MNVSSKRIWPDTVTKNDRYAEFYDSFGFAGSLNHGWSAMHVCYYSILREKST